MVRAPHRLAEITGDEAPIQRGGVLQLAPSEAEKQRLRDRLGAAADNYQFRTTDDGTEIAVGVGNTFYRLIRPAGGTSYWRQQKTKRTGGRGFYGRLADAPPSMHDIARNVMEREVLEATPVERFRAIHFDAGASLGNRDDNNRVMGAYFLGAGSISASVYALRGDCEWLHMQGHGLGGVEVATNLYAGSHGANSEMAAIEGAIQVLNGLYGGVSVDVQVLTDDDWHTDAHCNAIAAELGLDAAAVRASMQTKESRYLEFITYSVSVNGQEVWSQRILPFQDQRFDEAQFRELNERVRRAIAGQRQLIKFVSGGILGGSKPPPPGPPPGGGASGSGGKGPAVDDGGPSAMITT
ncbi:MAG: hypothetical protein JO164_12970 [Candidatus Eremiobacteraeota bacterium]|nr:hypothetical protein [Candidatus Eremiobacteraeota bacterium]